MSKQPSEKGVCVVRWDGIRGKGKGRPPRAIRRRNRYCTEYRHEYEDETFAKEFPRHRQPLELMFDSFARGDGKGVELVLIEDGEEHPPVYYPRVIERLPDGRRVLVRATKIIVNADNGRITVVIPCQPKPTGLQQFVEIAATTVQESPKALWTGCAVFGLYELAISAASVARAMMFPM